jgi:hypothetical protein
MPVSVKEVADLLVMWRDSGQSVSLSFTGGSDSPSWRRTGKVTAVELTKFEVSWDNGDSQSFSYDELTDIAEGGKLLVLTSLSGDRVTVREDRS